MPIALDPTETFEVFLKTDESKPPDTRPVFVFRYMTGRRRRVINRLYRRRVEIDELPADQRLDEAEKLTGELYAAVGAMLAGWRNMPAEFDAAALDSLITDGEAWELFFQMQRGGRLENEDSKKSESLSPTSTDESAPADAPAPAGAVD